MLDDPETAQYTHTLTVTERLGGQYQCTVANNKPSNATAQFTLQGALHKLFLILYFVRIQISMFTNCTSCDKFFTLYKLKYTTVA